MVSYCLKEVENADNCYEEEELRGGIKEVVRGEDGDLEYSHSMEIN